MQVRATRSLGAGRMLRLVGAALVALSAVVLIPTASFAERQDAKSIALFYNASTGTAASGVVGSDGRYINLRTFTGWLTGWTNIVPADPRPRRCSSMSDLIMVC